MTLVGFAWKRSVILVAAVICFRMWSSAPARAQTPGCPAGPGVWETRAPLPVEATEVGSAAIGDKVYVLGGILPDGSSSNRLFIYDATTDRWSEGPPLPIAGGINHPNVVAANLAPAADGIPELYVLGGLLGTGFPTNQTFVLDQLRNSWRELAPMITARGAAGIAARTRIYVAGGLVRSAEDVVSSNSFESFDPVANTWTRLTNLSTPRDHLTAQVVCTGTGAEGECVQPQVVAFGGRRNGVNLNLTEAFDTTAGQWTTRPGMPTARAGIASTVLGNSAHVFGGEGASTPTGTFRENEAFTLATNTWCAAAPMLTPRHGFYAAAVSPAGADPAPVFTVAGGPVAGAFFSNVNEVYFPPATAPATMDPGGLVNAASFQREVASGSIVSLFGQNLTYRALIQPSLPLPTQLNGTSVLVNGVPAALLFTSARQINMIIPSGTSSPATITFRKGGRDFVVPETITVLPAAPGIFTADGSGRGQGAILISGTGQLANASRPARVGDALEIFLTGLLDCPAGSACIQVAPDVTIGGVAAPVLFYGNAPGFAGLNQLNVRVPPGVAPGAAVPVRVSHSGRASNEVTIAVQ